MVAVACSASYPHRHPSDSYQGYIEYVLGLVESYLFLFILTAGHSRLGLDLVRSNGFKNRLFFSPHFKLDRNQKRKKKRRE